LETLERKRSKERRERALRSISTVLSTPEGRDALWYFLDQTGMNAPNLWEGSSKINYNVALRDFGKFMQDTMAEANENALLEAFKTALHRDMQARLEEQKILESEKENR
jgi:hypothetical protein